MKKLLLLLALAAIGLGLYFFKIDGGKPIVLQPNDQIAIHEPTVPAKSEDKSVATNAPKKVDTTNEKPDLAQSEAMFDEVESSWKGQIESFFTAEELAEYLKTRDEFELQFEKMEEEYFSSGLSSNSHKVSEPLGGKKEELQKEFLEALESKIGLDRTREYARLKERFNLELMKKDFSYKAFTIDF